MFTRLLIVFRCYKARALAGAHLWRVDAKQTERKQLETQLVLLKCETQINISLIYLNYRLSLALSDMETWPIMSLVIFAL